jgi:hypothetical protein
VVVVECMSVHVRVYGRLIVCVRVWGVGVCVCLWVRVCVCASLSVCAYMYACEYVLTDRLTSFASRPDFP